MVHPCPLGQKTSYGMCGAELNSARVNKKAQHHGLPGRLNQFRL